MLIFLILNLLFIITGHVLIKCTPYKTAGQILTFLGGIPLMIAGGFLFLLMMLFASSETKLLSGQQILMLLLCVPVCLIGIALHWKKFWKKRYILPLAAVLLVGIVLYARTLYIGSIPVVSNKDTAGYSPYDERLIPYELKEPSSLQLKNALPKLDGATALYPVYASFFRAVYPQMEEWNSFLRCSTTSGAYDRIIDGSADIIFVAEASQEQAAKAAEQGVELKYTPIGSEAFVFIVNSRNPLKNITVDNIRRIYRGEITSWDQLGVKGMGKILAFQRSKGSGSQTAFEKLIARGEEMPVAQTEEVIDAMGGLYDKIADYRNFRNAIGYSFRYYCTEMLGGEQIRILSINGIDPTPEHIADGTYPFTGHFYAVTRSDADENTARFLDWITGKQGQQIISNVGYLPLSGLMD